MKKSSYSWEGSKLELGYCCSGLIVDKDGGVNCWDIPFGALSDLWELLLQRCVEEVLIEYNPDLEKQAWLDLSHEEGKSMPQAFVLRRIKGPSGFVSTRPRKYLEAVIQTIGMEGMFNVEAAHDARMNYVVVASKHPVYELGVTDLVVKQLDELSIIDLKNLAAVESAEFGSG
ncbi:UNVERIFIED_CONTAM: 5-amino-6-(5-phospho-D-ribitylamino)uracil phosphatase, chloroplastic [Sesamum angustifolium]|uniref:5-amino-6-(5-phospho-D-ribitylamino)uracil phosphatase, chloroplastic n=1 Tax=Sesamum angustifolium TaxID=2727405 RepID=A0AAW2K6K8_9LAMI